MTPIITSLSLNDADKFDYIIVGGGTAGCVIATRVAEALPKKKVLVIEGGPSDFLDKRVSDLKQWIDLLGTELDYDYPIAEQPRGNSTIRQSRAKVLGGCSSHNGAISLHTFEHDCRLFQRLGCPKWSFDAFRRLINKTRLTYQIVDESRRNELMSAWVAAASTTFGVPVIDDINRAISTTGLVGGTGYMPIAYEVSNRDRISASTSYIHPLIRGERSLPNLRVLVNTWVSRVNVSDDEVTGVDIQLASGKRITLRHRAETILCGGAIDTPRLMLLSGLGPKQGLADVGVPCEKNIPGVGENLQDHVETNVIWELKRPAPPETVTHSDVFLYADRDGSSATDPDGPGPNIMFHCYTAPQIPNFEHLGVTPPKYPLVMMPNIPRPKSRGRMFLASADASVKPVLDFRYFTDPEGYDEATLMDGIKMCRKLAQASPLKEWIAREVAPGPNVTSDKAIAEYARTVSTTLFHPCGTTKMGDIEKDPLAVVDHQFRVRGLRGVRIADAGVMPACVTTNPMLTVLAIAEHAAEEIIIDGQGSYQSNL